MRHGFFYPESEDDESEDDDFYGRDFYEDGAYYEDSDYGLSEDEDAGPALYCERLALAGRKLTFRQKHRILDQVRSVVLYLSSTAR